MAQLQLLLLLLFLCVRLCAGEYVQVLLGDPVTLYGDCKTEEQCRLLRVEPHGIREVAVRQRGAWRPARGYQTRISESSSVVFNRAAYTDTGAYELVRSGQVVTIHLDVVVPFKESVREGSAVSLPCYYSTTGSACWSVSWFKDGKLVFEQDSCTDKSTGAADGRLSLSADWFPHGDLSLNLQQAQREDQGDYFCYIQERGALKQRGNPAAVRLTVSERSWDQTTSTPPSVSPTKEVCEETPVWAGVTITAALCLIVGLVGGCWLKSFQSTGASCSGLSGARPGRSSESRDSPSQASGQIPFTGLCTNGRHDSNTLINDAII